MDNIKKLLKGSYALPTLIVLLVSASVVLNIPSTRAFLIDAVTPNQICCDDEVIPDGVAHIVISAPETANIGDLVEVDVSKSTAASFKWLVTPETKNIRIIDGGKRLLFSHGRTKTFDLVVAAALEDTVDVARVRIVVKGKSPVNPDDTDHDESEPSLGAWGKRMQPWLATVDTDSKRDETLALAQSFKTIAAKISAGVLKNEEEIIEETRIGNKIALDSSVPSWEGFLQPLREHLNSMGQAGGLSSVADHAKVWRDIADGLQELAATI